MAFENNVQGTLYANVAIAATTIDVNKAVAPDKDVPEEGRLTLFAVGVTEIITYTGRVDNTTYWTLTGVVKNTEVGVGDQSWSAGDGFFQAVTARDLTGFMTVRVPFIATANQSTKSGLTYTVGNLDCFINGSLMTIDSDFTANNGTSVTFTPALTELDEVQLFMNIGATTADGVDGADGEQGIQGFLGYDGPQGPQGDQGIQGDQGETGADSTVAGPPGADGADGADGGGGGSEADFIASGTLPNGSMVILKPNGTVEAVSTVGATPNIGAPIVYDTSVSTMFIAYDPFTANQFVLVYVDAAAVNIVIGTIVAGSTLTFGTPFQLVAGASNPQYVLFDPSVQGAFVVGYYFGGSYDLISGTISGTSITTGTSFDAASSIVTAKFDPSVPGRFITLGGPAHNITVSVYDITGNTIALTSSLNFTHSNVVGMEMAMDPNTAGSLILMWATTSTPYYSYLRPVTVSGASITLGTTLHFTTTRSSYNHIHFKADTANEFILVYDDMALNDMAALVGTISGITVSLSTPVALGIGRTYVTAVAYDPLDASRFALFYGDSSNNYYVSLIVGQVTGAVFTFDTPIVVQSLFSPFVDIAFDPYILGAYFLIDRDSLGDSQLYLGQLATVAAPNITTGNLVGASTAAYTNGQTATITLQGGLSTNQTGLTIGATYYAQADGTLATTADTVRVVAGKALSATSMLLAAFEDVDVSGGPTTGGDLVYEDGVYTYHKFTTSGIFTNNIGSFDYLVVAGGGGGGTQVSGVSNGGGGGAGGYLSGILNTSGAIAITVGAGGAPDTVGLSGGDSQVGDTIVALGGGGGGQSALSGGDGGSGGGSSAYGAAAAGGSGTVGQGSDGADGTPNGTWIGGGGGGAGGVGVLGGSAGPGTGGAGLDWQGLGTLYAGGGGGGGNSNTWGLGGAGGGGAGGSGSSYPPEDGAANTGGGGGGSGGAALDGANGGSGIVLIRYLT
jgi:hypothetical protein